jgi:hypothetical protein
MVLSSLIRPSSKVIIKFVICRSIVLNCIFCFFPALGKSLPDLVFVYIGYICKFEYLGAHKSVKIVVELNGRLNHCGVIHP